MCNFLMARPEIKSGAALKGKKVGVSSFGATGDLATRVALQSLGLDPNRDVTIGTSLFSFIATALPSW
ncbi:MAG: hypothetical protein HY695_25895 [Deltaproteobacteria bacterium]|nr:hypothetical protein [Deltaproteobacteria bacterium]